MSENGFFSKYFDFQGNNTNMGREINAGITTFMTMAYILVVNPIIMADAGMDMGAVFTATALSSMIATLFMAFLAKLPFALAPGMGLNAFFAYYVVLQLGYSWEMALTAVFLEGIIFILLSFFNVREAIINSIPLSLKKAISVGIGLFIAFIGVSNVGLIVQGDGVVLALGNILDKEVLMTLAGIVFIAILISKNVKGAILIGIFVMTLVGIPLGVTQFPTGGLGAIFSAPPSLAPTFMKFDWSKIFSADMMVIVFTFLMIDMFDTVGTLVGVSTKAGMLDEEGKVPRAKEALLSDAIGTVFGAMLGTSTVTTYVESASGVAEGGRTGMSAFTTSILFLLSLFFAPLFLMVPTAATAPALVIVGCYMMSPVGEINWQDFTEAVPAFLTIAMMPFAYAINEGIVFGIISFALIKLFAGRGKEVPKLTYVIAFLFALAKVFL
ncbi:MAG: NCS2 family permease [Tissierellia bacterium]|nr:NCS2 family permease [Tissierellia bacterium]